MDKYVCLKKSDVVIPEGDVESSDEEDDDEDESDEDDSDAEEDEGEDDEFGDEEILVDVDEVVAEDLELELKKGDILERKSKPSKRRKKEVDDEDGDLAPDVANLRLETPVDAEDQDEVRQYWAKFSW